MAPCLGYPSCICMTVMLVWLWYMNDEIVSICPPTHSLRSSGFSPSVSWTLYLSLRCQVSIRSGFSPPKSHKLLEHIDPVSPCAPLDMKLMFSPTRCIVSTLHSKLKWVEEGFFARKSRKGRMIDCTAHLIAIQMKFLNSVCS